MTELDTQRYRLSSRVRFRRVDHEGVFVLQESGEVLVVNNTGADVVELLESGQDAQSVAKQIADDYGLELSLAERDVTNIIEQLLQAHAIEKKEAA